MDSRTDARGSVSFSCKLEDGWVVRRHVDYMRTRCRSFTELLDTGESKTDTIATTLSYWKTHHGEGKNSRLVTLTDKALTRHAAADKRNTRWKVSGDFQKEQFRVRTLREQRGCDSSIDGTRHSGGDDDERRGGGRKSAQTVDERQKETGQIRFMNRGGRKEVFKWRFMIVFGGFTVHAPSSLCCVFYFSFCVEVRNVVVSTTGPTASGLFPAIELAVVYAHWFHSTIYYMVVAYFNMQDTIVVIRT